MEDEERTLRRGETMQCHVSGDTQQIAALRFITSAKHREAARSTRAKTSDSAMSFFANRGSLVSLDLQCT